tara:strand:+ start:812 stop:982 length:171 start_codon:yes stop_codon:yes gene_type:complete
MKTMKTMKDLLIQLESEAKEEIDCGNSKEKAFGYGIQEAINRIKTYCKENNIKLHI